MTDASELKSFKSACLDAVLSKGLHHDVTANFNSYIQQFIRVFTENFAVEYEDTTHQPSYKHRLHSENIHFIKPQTNYSTLDTPLSAILRDNYEAIAKGDLVYTVTCEETLIYKTITNDFTFFSMPAPMNSDLCNTGVGLPYGPDHLVSSNFNLPAFCVNRTFKIAPMEESFCLNVPLCFKLDKCEIRCEFRKASRVFRTNSTLVFICKEKSRRIKSIRVDEFTYLMTVPYETPKKYVPVEVLVYLLGDKESFVTLLHQIFKPQTKLEQFALSLCLDLVFRSCYMDREKAQKVFISKLTQAGKQKSFKEKVSYLNYTVQEEIFPNGKSLKDKLLLLVMCIARLIRNSTPYIRHAHVDSDLDCKESYALKRIDTVGLRLCMLLRKYTKHLSRRSLLNLKKILINTRVLSKVEHFKRVVSDRVIKLTASVRNGVFDFKSNTSDFNRNKTQILGTGFSSDGIMVEANKIVKGFLKKNSAITPLLTHPSQFGRICMYLTPESLRCAVTRFKATGGYITPYIDKELHETHAVRVLSEHLRDFTPNATLILSSYGECVGWTQHPKQFYLAFVRQRRAGKIDRFLNVGYNAHWLQIHSEAGRIQRPLFVAEKLRECVQYVTFQKRTSQLISLTELCAQGFIEYLDAGEEYSGLVLVATSIAEFMENPPIFTHVEISGELAMCLTVARAFTNHNQGPRRMYTGNLEKRAISCKKFEDFGNISSYSLWYSQLPIVSEQLDRVFQLRLNEPTSCNVSIAILSLANNIEDSWVFKKEAFERGLLVSSEFVTITHSVSGREQFKKPSYKSVNHSRLSKYASIKGDGLPKIGQVISYGMVVVGKVITIRQTHGQLVEKCTSKFLERKGSFTVRRVFTYPPGATGSDRQLVRVTLQGCHTPEIGDKFFLAHGQKATVGRILPTQDLPFIDSGVNAGMVPDVIINVCSLMRVTMGLLLEIFAGKVRSLKPSVIDQYDTMFIHAKTINRRFQIWKQVLKHLGLSSSGKDYFRDGRTGQLLQKPLYNGFASIRALKQLAKDKLRSRDKGPIIELTRQTTVGKRVRGGLRFGEMEVSSYCFGVYYTIPS